MLEPHYDSHTGTIYLKSPLQTDSIGTRGLRGQKAWPWTRGRAGGHAAMRRAVAAERGRTPEDIPIGYYTVLSFVVYIDHICVTALPALKLVVPDLVSPVLRGCSEIRRRALRAARYARALRATRYAGALRARRYAPGCRHCPTHSGSHRAW